MKRKVLIIFCLTIFLLTSCKNKIENDEQVQNENVLPIPVEVKKSLKELHVNPATFHFVAHWLSDSDIVYIEKENGVYYVKRFNVETGEIAIMYEEDTAIIDVIIHPSKKYLLLHTSDNPTSANVKIISTDGVVLDELVVASSELAIEWNDIDPSLILLSAFHPDWTFDLFYYNGHTNYFGLLDVDDPFPKWLGTEKIAIGYVEDHLLDGGDILTYDLSTKKWDKLEYSGIVYFDTFYNKMLFVQIEEENANYFVKETDGQVQYEWSLPAVSNYSEWVIPPVEWVSDVMLFLPHFEKGGQLDELSSLNQLVRVKNGEMEQIVNELEIGALKCSPSGQRCLVGHSSDTIIDVITKDQHQWFYIDE